jgi:hypothetical protein
MQAAGLGSTQPPLVHASGIGIKERPALEVQTQTQTQTPSGRY